MFTALLAGIFYLFTFIPDEILLFSRDDILVSAQVLFVIYTFVIIYTSLHYLIRFKNKFPPKVDLNKQEKGDV